MEVVRELIGIFGTAAAALWALGALLGTIMGGIRALWLLISTKPDEITKEYMSGGGGYTTPLAEIKDAIELLYIAWLWPVMLFWLALKNAGPNIKATYQHWKNSD